MKSWIRGSYDDTRGPELQAYLARMVQAEMEYAVLETTSHGLAQHRVTGSEYDVAAVTNITHEHLDYHGSYEAYRDAKAMLFRSLSTRTTSQACPKWRCLTPTTVPISICWHTG